MDWNEYIVNKLTDIEAVIREHKAQSEEHAKESEVRLTAIEKDLNYHIHRTNLLEAKCENIETEIKPIKRHVVGINYIVSAVILAGSLAAAITKIKGMW